MQKPRHFIRRTAPHGTSADTLRIADIWIELKSAIATLPPNSDYEFKRAQDRFGTLLCERCCALNPLVRAQFEEGSVTFDDAVRSALPIPKRRGSIAHSTVSRARTVDFPSARGLPLRADTSRIIVPQVIRKVVPKAALAPARSLTGVQGSSAKFVNPTLPDDEVRFQRPRARPLPQSEGPGRGQASRKRSGEVPELTPLSGGHRPWPSALTPAFPGRLMSMPAVPERLSIQTSVQSKLHGPPLRVLGDRLFFVFDGLRDDADLEGCDTLPRTPEAGGSARGVSRQVSLPGEEDEDVWLVCPTSADAKRRGTSTGEVVLSAAAPCSSETTAADLSQSQAPETARVSAASGLPRKVPLGVRTASSRVVVSDDSPQVFAEQECSFTVSGPTSPKNTDASSHQKNNKKRGWVDATAKETEVRSGREAPPEPASSEGAAPQAPPVTPPSARGTLFEPLPTPAAESSSNSPAPAEKEKKKKSNKKRKAPTEEPKSKKKKRKKMAESIYVASLCSPNRVPKRLTDALSAAEQAKEVLVQTESDLYEVEAIREMMIDRYEKCEYFLVKWENYAEVDNTWEPSENLEEFGHHKERMEFLRRLYHTKLMVSQNVARNPDYSMSFSVNEDPEFVRLIRAFNNQERTRRLDGSELFHVTASTWAKPTLP